MLLRYLKLLMVSFFLVHGVAHAQTPTIKYTLTIPAPASHKYHVELLLSGWDADTLTLKLPRWMPGYYQIMDYAKAIENITLVDAKGKAIPFARRNNNTLVIGGLKKKSLLLAYDVATSRKFVAESYVDEQHAYLIPEASFFYVEDRLDFPVEVVIKNSAWENVATGLMPVPGKVNVFAAQNFDVLYDCPILLGNLQSLPKFDVNGVPHEFIGYQLGTFNTEAFINNLQKVATAASDVIGDIPFAKYTFIGIGPGRGGIEHLNNTTVSFDGNGLDDPGAMNGMMNFLAHEYFHHYNVKRIRPLELGPFDYEKGSRTNLLWVSEGLSVYYEYLIVRRAGLCDEKTLLENFEHNINDVENNPGRHYQSLAQASYNTWSDGPFGKNENLPGQTISYYEKGPVVALLIDFAIRHATKNAKSLDDVMRLVYWRYYRKAGRGFTDAEFQQACEEVAGAPLSELFEYVYTTKELDYNKYLGYAGLKLESSTNVNDQKKVFKIRPVETPDNLQQAIFRSWAGAR